MITTMQSSFVPSMTEDKPLGLAKCDFNKSPSESKKKKIRQNVMQINNTFLPYVPSTIIFNLTSFLCIRMIVILELSDVA